MIVEYLCWNVYLTLDTCDSKCFLIEKYGFLNRIITIKMNVECTQGETVWSKKDYVIYACQKDPKRRFIHIIYLLNFKY